MDASDDISQSAPATVAGASNRRTICWTPLWNKQREGFGLEHLLLDERTADSVCLAFDEERGPFRLSYRLTWDAAWRLSDAALIVATGCATRALNLQADGQGHWRHRDGCAIDALDGCIDLDIWPTPFTNTFPIRRAPMAVGERREFRMAWVAAPSLTISPQPQAYTRLDEHRYLSRRSTAPASGPNSPWMAMASWWTTRGCSGGWIELPSPLMQSGQNGWGVHTMSVIDQYKHTIIGEVECPSDYDFVRGSATRILPVYQLEEAVPADETDFDGKCGDLLVGGGSGEAQALRISYPEARDFFLGPRADGFERRGVLYQHFWSPSFAYKLGVGFRKLGWDPETPLDRWLAERVIRNLFGAGRSARQ